jgi:hypothetical protein
LKRIRTYAVRSIALVAGVAEEVLVHRLSALTVIQSLKPVIKIVTANVVIFTLPKHAKKHTRAE